MNLKRPGLQKYIYRIISYDRFLDLFKLRENVLVRPSLWEDAFENITLRSRFRYPDGTQVDLDAHKRIYGQCWTASGASDAMWRIYSPDKRGVRIRTTIEELFDSLDAANVDKRMVESCVGRVEYESEQEIIRRARNAFSPDGRISFGDLFRSLLVKRKAFSHENEIRLMWLDWGYNIPHSDYCRYRIDPHQLISQVMIDPRISHDEFKSIKEEIVSKTCYRGEIKRSLLYRLPKKIVVEVNLDLANAD